MLHQIHENLNGFRDGFLRGNPGLSNQTEVRYLRRWLDHITFSCLKDLERVFTEDASTLVRIILDCDKEPFRQL